MPADLPTRLDRKAALASSEAEAALWRAAAAAVREAAEWDGPFERMMGHIDGKAWEYFKSVGRPPDRATNFGEAALLLLDEVQRRSAECQPRRSTHPEGEFRVGFGVGFVTGAVCGVVYTCLGLLATLGEG